MLKDKTLTYISLFSSAGVGCYGFKQNGFECIATNEIISRRLDIQRFNNKCRFNSGYICDDITLESTKNAIHNEINKWKKLGNDKVDVLIATPPCQGMSVANHKKADNEIVRNSLVVESVQIVKDISPRFFIFENVPAFMKTGCTAPDGTIKAIGDMIFEELGEDYVITSRILNFKNYGSNSSRTRTVVIGVLKSLSDYITPIELYPQYRDEKTLREVIGDLPSLEWGEICDNDFYHAFRTYPIEMRPWISELKEGEGAFDNEDVTRRPHKIVDGEIVFNTQKNADKYTRQYWDKVGPCIHTRNDQLASQNTVHPTEDRVFSIRELMRMMTIPQDFRWTDYSLDELNSLSQFEKSKMLKKEEIKIRQSIGEAVPTSIFYQIARAISKFMNQEHLDTPTIIRLIKDHNLDNSEQLKFFVRDNPYNLGYASLARVAELANSKRESNAAYYTNKFIVNEIFKELPTFEKNTINIVEPSVGVGNFLPFVFKKYENIPCVNIDVVDIDNDNLEILKLLLEKQGIPQNVHIRYVHHDFLTTNESQRYDLLVGNPPFEKLKPADAKLYLKSNINQDTTNTFEFFLEKGMRIASNVALICPKFILNTPEFSTTRKYLASKNVYCIHDYGECGFKGVLVETVCIFVKPNEKPGITKIFSMTLGLNIVQKQSYIMDEEYPYWIIYRNSFFDSVAEKMNFGKFSVVRDRQITNANTTFEKRENSIQVIKSRNISDDGQEVISIDGYDSYIDCELAKSMSVYRFMNDDSVYLTPNMTYKPRVMKKKKGFICNGSVAILIPKEKIELTKTQMRYYASDEYRSFYKIARNYQTRSLNVDTNSVFFYGILKEGGV